MATSSGLSIKGDNIQDRAADKKDFSDQRIRSKHCHILISSHGATKPYLKYDLDGGLYPGLQPCGLPLVS